MSALAPSRWRPRVPLLLLLVVVLAVAYLVRPADPTRHGDAPHVATFDPVAWWRAAFGAEDAAGGGAAARAADEALRRENAALRAELTIARQENERWRRGLEQGRAGTTIDFPPQFVFVAADVVGASPEPRRHALRINRGARHGLRPDMPVLTDRGLVGIVRRVGDTHAIVQLVTDPFFVVAARAADERWPAVARGRGADGGVQVEPLAALPRLPDGEMLLTAGGDDSLYPPGLPIGVMRPAGSDKFGMDLILCEPVHGSAPLEFVLVLVNRR